MRTRLLAVSGVSTLTTRIHQGYAPTGSSLPYIVIHALGGTPHHHIGAASKIGETTLQLDVYAATGASRDALAEAIRNAADGWAGSSLSVDIRTIILDPPANSVEGRDAGRENAIYRSRIDARVWFAQAAPTL